VLLYIQLCAVGRLWIETESWQYSHYILCDGNATSSYKIPSDYGITLVFGVEEISLPNTVQETQ